MVKTTETLEKLRNLLVEYQNGALSTEKGFVRILRVDILLEILESLSVDFSCLEELTEEEKTWFVSMLMAFGEMDDTSDVPHGRAIQFGYGSLVQRLIKELTPRCKRWLKWGTSFGLLCLAVCLITKLLFASFAVGFFTVLTYKAFGGLLKYIPAIYIQNELLLRRHHFVTKGTENIKDI